MFIFQTFYKLCCCKCCNKNFISGNLYNFSTKKPYNNIIKGFYNESKYKFEINFPNDCSVWDKLNIISCVLFYQYKYFTKNETYCFKLLKFLLIIIIFYILLLIILLII